MAKRLEKIIFFLLLILFVMSLVLTLLFFYNQEKICQLDPLVYGAKIYKKNSGADMVWGEIVLVKELSNPLRIYFDEKKSGEGN